MCSIIFCRTAEPIESDIIYNANSLQKMRGPDYTGMKTIIDHHGAYLLFIHNLLDISGQNYKQPIFIHDNGNYNLLLFNGELYGFNGTLYNSDTESLVSLITYQSGLRPNAMDGEYIIIYYQQSLDQLSVLTDTFLTKPLYFGFKNKNNDFAIATYASSLSGLGFDKIKMASPNSFYQVIFRGEYTSFEKVDEVKRFSLKQEKIKYDDWIDAFLSAVRKRAFHGAHRFFVALSSGYDSGAICLALNLLNIKYDTFSIEANESKSVLKSRIQKNISESCSKAYAFKGLSDRIIKIMRNDIISNVEPFIYIHEDGPSFHTNISEDLGALGMNYIAKNAAKKGIKVTLSGAGADEIYSDYGYKGLKIYSHSEFGGIFPDKLEPFFPWKKFYGDTQRSYLFKEEFILGRHGIEGRYPFLDNSVVQEFLSLTSELKNLEYKAPIAYFLKKYNYPFDRSVKKGFNPYSQSIMDYFLKTLRINISQLKNKIYFKQ